MKFKSKKIFKNKINCYLFLVFISNTLISYAHNDLHLDCKSIVLDNKSQTSLIMREFSSTIMAERYLLGIRLLSEAIEFSKDKHHFLVTTIQRIEGKIVYKERFLHFMPLSKFLVLQNITQEKKDLALNAFYQLREDIYQMLNEKKFYSVKTVDAPSTDLPNKKEVDNFGIQINTKMDIPNKIGTFYFTLKSFFINPLTLQLAIGDTHFTPPNHSPKNEVFLFGVTSEHGDFRSSRQIDIQKERRIKYEQRLAQRKKRESIKEETFQRNYSEFIQLVKKYSNHIDLTDWDFPISSIDLDPIQYWQNRKLTQLPIKLADQHNLNSSELDILNNQMPILLKREHEIRNSLKVISILFKTHFSESKYTERIENLINAIKVITSQDNPHLSDLDSFISYFLFLSVDNTSYERLLRSMEKWFIGRMKEIEGFNQIIDANINYDSSITYKRGQEFSSMDDLELEFDVLCRKTLQPNLNFKKSLTESISEVDVAFLNYARGIPDFIISILEGERATLHFSKRSEKVFSLGHKGAIDFLGSLSNNSYFDETIYKSLEPGQLANRFYGVIFPKSFINIYGGENTIKILPIGYDRFFDPLGSINPNLTKAFLIQYEKNRKQVHVSFSLPQLRINGKIMRQIDFFRAHALGVVEFNKDGKILKIKWF